MIVTFSEIGFLHFTKMSLPDRENTPIIIRRNDDGDLSFETDAQDFFQLEDEVPSVFLENALKNGPITAFSALFWEMFSFQQRAHCTR